MEKTEKRSEQSWQRKEGEKGMGSGEEELMIGTV
jgi:hypothetical protein